MRNRTLCTDKIRMSLCTIYIENKSSHPHVTVVDYYCYCKKKKTNIFMFKRIASSFYKILTYFTVIFDYRILACDYI